MLTSHFSRNVSKSFTKPIWTMRHSRLALLTKSLNHLGVLGWNRYLPSPRAVLYARRKFQKNVSSSQLLSSRTCSSIGSGVASRQTRRKLLAVVTVVSGAAEELGLAASSLLQGILETGQAA